MSELAAETWDDENALVGDAGALAEDVRSWFAAYVKTMDPSDLDLLTVWTLHTHLLPQLYSTPRIIIDSPMPGSGKTTCLDHLARLCYKPTTMAAVSSDSLLAHLTADEPVTLLIDEADRSLRKDNPNSADLLAVLNSGYRKGGARPVLVPSGRSWEPVNMPTHSAVVMAGNSPDLPDDTRSRSIPLTLLPARPGDVAESDWEILEQPAADLHERITAWADGVRDEVALLPRDMPQQVTNRFKEKWLPLKRVALLIGGSWPQRIDTMAVHDVEDTLKAQEEGLQAKQPHLLLIEDAATAWPDGQEFVAAQQLADTLSDQWPERWGAHGPAEKRMTTQRLGKMLAKFKITTDRGTVGDRRRGYRAAVFVRVWNQLGIPIPPNVPARAPDKPDEPATVDISDELPSGLAGLSDELPSGLAGLSDELPSGLAGLSDTSGYLQAPTTTPSTPPEEPANTAPLCLDCGGPLPPHDIKKGHSYHATCGPYDPNLPSN